TDYQRWPYRYKVTLSWLRSSGGRYSHYLRLKVPDISGTGFGLRLDLSAARDIRARYYGLGNESERVGAYTDRKSGDLYRDENYYSYILEEPRLIFSLLRRIRGPLSMSMGLGLETTDVSPRGKVSFYQEEGRFIEGVPESADQSHRRVDTVDGVSGFVSVTVDWDTRDDPTIPRTGTYHEWSYESSRNSLLGLLFEEIDYRRYTFTDARYRALSDRLGLATRMIYEILDGEVPLYAYGEIGGSYRVKGAGGSDTLRGFDRQRFTDNVRLLSNTEVRYRLHAQRAFKQYLEWHGVYFVDTGQVASSSHHLGLLRTHVSSGVGLRLYWNADFVIRADLGLSVEQAYLGFKYRNVF
ncbi:MAG: BamA/TamA family outer membrane protein, partial [Gemmatimonadota bacterium]